MRLREIVERVQQLKSAVDLKAYNTMPFSSLTARSDLMANRPPEPKNEYTLREKRLIAQLLENMSKSRVRVVKARTNARQTFNS